MTCGVQTEQQKPPLKEMPEIRVNGIVIEPSRLAGEMQYHPASSFEEALQEAAYALIVRELLLQQAREEGIAIDSSETAEETAIQALLEKAVDYPKADDEACRTYFEANSERFVSPPLLEASHILLAADPRDLEAREKARKQAEELIQQIQQKPQCFTLLVEQCSDCPSKKTQGNLGQLSKGQTTPEFERQLFALGEGLAESAIESRYGFHVVRVDRKIDGEPLPFDVVRDKIAVYLNAAVERQAVSTYLRRLVAEAEIQGINLAVDADSLEILQ